MTNELASIDLEIRTLQLNFAHTFLFSPSGGLVTAVYKDLGERVDAGEPVLRIENDTTLFAVGRVQFRGVLRIDQTVQIVADELFEREGDSRTFDGKIVSIRGHESDDDEWDIIIEFPNPVDGGRRLLPLNYTFDACTQ